jgi:hypothetical protein
MQGFIVRREGRSTVSIIANIKMDEGVRIVAVTLKTHTTVRCPWLIPPIFMSAHDSGITTRLLLLGNQSTPTLSMPSLLWESGIGRRPDPV